LGGSDKGADYSQLAQEVKRSNINQVFITGATAQKIRLALDHVEFTNFTITDSDMSEIINQAQKIAKPGDVVVLSPACASFDKYQNYIERGEAFKKAVESLNK
jgi:UDP-N-acetylmuramoylalanine--D-glutamate ligase